MNKIKTHRLAAEKKSTHAAGSLKSSKNLNFSFIGAGNIAKSLITGLLKADYSTQKFIVSNRSQEKLLNFQKEFGVCIAENNSKAVENVDIIFLAVKPAIIQTVCKEIANIPLKKNSLIVSLAAAISTNTITKALGDSSLPIVRAMTNTASGINEAVTSLFFNKNVTESQKKIIIEIFNSVGRTFCSKNETEQNKWTSLIGCGTAYLFLFTEALEKAAISLGLSKKIVYEVSRDLVYGSALLAKNSDETLMELRKKVTTPKGITAAAVDILLEGNYFDLFKQALVAAVKREKNIADEYKKLV